MKVKHNSLKQQCVSAELEGIIEEFGSAMRNANRPYIGLRDLNLTPRMKVAWYKYVEFCNTHPNG